MGKAAAEQTSGALRIVRAVGRLVHGDQVGVCRALRLAAHHQRAIERLRVEKAALRERVQ